MSIYHEKIKMIKENSFKDFMRIYYEGNEIILRVVDTSDETVRLLTEWRKKAMRMFGTNFNANEDRTRKWIQKNILENPNAILFMIYINNKKVGHLGTDKYDEKQNVAELENYVKDPSFNFPGLMSIIEKHYLQWLFDGLKLSKVITHVFSDNYRIMNVHLRCGGWIIKEVIPLKRIFVNGEHKWVKTELQNETEFAERYFNKMEITKEGLTKKIIDSTSQVLL